jgi:RNA polymerase sigma factor (sigma-70 family)
VTLTDLSSVPSPVPSAPVEDLARALERLEALDARKSEVVRLRFLWGYENEEVAGILGVSTATVERDWKFARAWLAAELEGGA